VLITFFKKTVYITVSILGSLEVGGSTQALEVLKDQVVCYKTAIKEPVTFYGNSGDKFTLYDGSQWKVTSRGAYEYIPYRYRDIVICPSLEKMISGDKALSIVELEKFR